MPDSHRVRDSVDTSRIDTERIDAERVDSDQAGPPGDPESVARIICLRLLDARPRTRAELATALRKRRVPAEAAAVVLDRFEEVGLIDDSAFARGWVTSRQAGRGLARGALAAELRRKGVPADTAQHALAEVDPELEAQTARALVNRRLATMRRLPAEVRLRRLVGMLARKGYSPSLAARVVRAALADEGVRADGSAAEDVADGVEDLDAVDSVGPVES